MTTEKIALLAQLLNEAKEELAHSEQGQPHTVYVTLGQLKGTSVYVEYGRYVDHTINEDGVVEVKETIL